MNTNRIFKAVALAAIITVAGFLPCAQAQPLGAGATTFKTYSSIQTYYTAAGVLTSVTNTVAGITNMIPKNATTTTPDLFSVWWNPYSTNGAWVRGTNAGIISLGSTTGRYLSLDITLTTVGNATNSTLVFARSSKTDNLAASVETSGTVSFAFTNLTAGTYNLHATADVGGDGQWQLQSWTVNNGAAGYVTNPIVSWRVK